MCNEVARRISLDIIREDFSQLKIPLKFPEGLPNLAPIDSIRITDQAALVRWGDDGAELVQRRWSWPGPTGKPVYNFRSDGRRLDTGRCLVPVDAFYEFTEPGARLPSPPGEGRLAQRAGVGDADLLGEAPTPTPPLEGRGSKKEKKKKDKWAFTKAGEDWFCLAGLWRADAIVGEAFTLLTCPPGPDVEPYHARQMVVVERRDWLGWLGGSVASSAVCVPLGAGVLEVLPVSANAR